MMFLVSIGSYVSAEVGVVNYPVEGASVWFYGLYRYKNMGGLTAISAVDVLWNQTRAPLRTQTDVDGHQ